MAAKTEKTAAGRRKAGRAPVSRTALKAFLDRVTLLAEPALAGLGLELVRAAALLAGGRPVIRLFIDRRDGAGGDSSVYLDDCAAASRALDEALEVEGGDQPDGYFLEVSSPGLDRPLLKAEDCRRFQGRLARLKLRRAEAGGVYRGRLAQNEAGGPALLTETGRLDFTWAEVVSGRLIPEAGEFLNPGAKPPAGLSGFDPS